METTLNYFRSHVIKVIFTFSFICILADPKKKLETVQTSNTGPIKSTDRNSYTNILKQYTYAERLGFIAKDGEFFTGATIINEKLAIADLLTLKNYINDYTQLRVVIKSKPNEENPTICDISKMAEERPHKNKEIKPNLVVITVSSTQYLKL